MLGVLFAKRGRCESCLLRTITDLWTFFIRLWVTTVSAAGGKKAELFKFRANEDTLRHTARQGTRTFELEIASND